MQNIEVFSFLDAGAEVISTNSYHTSLENIEIELKVHLTEAERLLEVDDRRLPLLLTLQLAVQLATQALRERNRSAEDCLLTSIGPFAVTRRDGSEYTGAYIDDGKHIAKV